RLPVPRLEPSLDHDRAALVQELATALGLFAPDDDGHETRVLALLPGLRREVIIDRQPQVRDRGAARRVSKLGGARQVSDEEYLVEARHQTTSPTAAGCCFGADRTRLRGGTRVDRNRSTCSFSPSCRSNSLITAGVAEHSITAYVPSRCLRIS